ncbi:MAG TPA: hypothetical protein VMU68_14910 [Acidimicrobiales bacterium]|nr:hypothetical protein [Acidimicrobiales bacterium]
MSVLTSNWTTRTTSRGRDEAEKNVTDVQMIAAIGRQCSSRETTGWPFVGP